MKKENLLLIIFFCCICSVSLFAQTERICTTHEYDLYLKSISPEYARKRAEIEKRILSESHSHPVLKTSGIPVVIPVVVHIVYNTPEQNLSDEQIISEIDALNEDYAAANANIVQVPSVWGHLVGDAGIRFKLARRDENGNETTGITRTATATPSFYTSNNVKFDSTGGHNAWDADHFLNVWVCNIGSSILGYAQYPGGDPKTDGVVITYKAFGRIGNNLSAQYNLGRSTTHEIGHWLNLFHVWGDDGGACNGSDQISDTPNQAKETYGCPSSVNISCNNAPDGDMFQDYMDYTDDKCMMFFTKEQQQVMNSILTNDRDSILSAESYTLPVSQHANDLKITYITAPYGVICDKNITPSLTIENTGSTVVTKFTLEYGVDNDSVFTYNWTGTLNDSAFVEIVLPEIIVSDDLHTFYANIISVNDNADDYTIDNFKTRSFIYAVEKYGCPAFPETPTDSIFPNPAVDFVTIKTRYKIAQRATVGIYNILGKKVFSKDYLDSIGESLLIDVRNWANGIYLLQINTFNKTAGDKFMVIH